MKNVLIYSYGIFLFTQTATASTEIPVNNLTTPVRYAKAPLRFKTYSSYLQYISIKVFKGVDSANAFYKREFENAAYNYIDYLPLTGGTVTGTTYLSAGSEGSISFYPFTLSAKYWQMNKGDAANTVWAFGYQNPSGSVGSDYVITSYIDNDGWKEKFRIQYSTGNIGIGTTSPGAKLHIKQSAQTSADGFRLDNSANDASLRAYNDGANWIISPAYSSGGALQPILFTSSISGSNTLFLSTVGNVGIGTISPTRKIDVAGTMRVSNKDVSWTTDNWANYFEIDPANAGGGGIIWKKQSTNITRGVLVNQGSMYFGRSTADDASAGFTGDMMINATGNVGIGTMSPGAPLDISGSSRAYMQFNETGTGGRVYQILSTNNANSDAGGGKFAFRDPGVSGSAGYRIIIDNTGNVGVGTANPDAGSKLHVAGGILVSGTLSSTSGSTGGFDYYGGGSRFFSMGTSGATKGTFTWIAKGADGSSTTPMIIDANGNVGIGTTLPSEKFSVNGNISTKKLIVTQTGWSDYVFTKGYKLRSLQNLEAFISQNKHLPEVPTAREVEAEGISVGDNQALLLKKIEELTLYMIEMNKTNDQMKAEIKVQAKEIRLLKQMNKR